MDEDDGFTIWIAGFFVIEGVELRNREFVTVVGLERGIEVAHGRGEGVGVVESCQKQQAIANGLAVLEGAGEIVTGDVMVHHINQFFTVDRLG